MTLEGEPFKSAALGGGDYRTVLRHAKEAKPDIFLWTGYDADALPIMEQAKEVGFAPPIFIGSPPGWPIGFGKSPLAEGVTLYGMWAPSIKEVSPVSKHFWEAYIKEYNQEPDFLTAYPKDPGNDRVLYQLSRAREQGGQLITFGGDALLDLLLFFSGFLQLFVYPGHR